MRDNTVWDIFAKLPEKRQKRLEEKLHNMDMDIQVAFNEITIVSETDKSILAMVPCISGDLHKSLYVEYFFDTNTVKLSHFTDESKHNSLFQRIKNVISYLRYGTSYYGVVSTEMDLESIEKLTDFLSAVIEDIYSQLEQDS